MCLHAVSMIDWQLWQQSPFLQRAGRTATWWGDVADQGEQGPGSSIPALLFAAALLELLPLCRGAAGAVPVPSAAHCECGAGLRAAPEQRIYWLVSATFTGWSQQPLNLGFCRVTGQLLCSRDSRSSAGPRVGAERSGAALERCGGTRAPAALKHLRETRARRLSLLSVCRCGFFSPRLQPCGMLSMCTQLHWAAFPCSRAGLLSVHQLPRGLSEVKHAKLLPVPSIVVRLWSHTETLWERQGGSVPFRIAGNQLRIQPHPRFL